MARCLMPLLLWLTVSLPVHTQGLAQGQEAPDLLPAQWTTVKAVDPAFSVAMPAEVEQFQERVPGPNGPTEGTVYVSSVAGALFTAQAMASPKPIADDPEAIETALDRERAGYVQATRGELIGEHRLRIDDHPGLEFTVEGPAPRGEGLVTSRSRLFLADSTFFILTVMSASDQSLPAEASRFFETFRLGDSNAKAQAVDPPEPAELTAKLQTPEGALRTFLLALSAIDESTLRVVTFPHDDFDWLLKGQPTPPNEVAQMQEIFAEIPIRALEPGDTYTLPGGREFQVGPGEVGPNRAMLVPDRAPMPTRLRRFNDAWRVDASPFITARKAAEEARQNE